MPLDLKMHREDHQQDNKMSAHEAKRLPLPPVVAPPVGILPNKINPEFLSFPVHN